MTEKSNRHNLACTPQCVARKSVALDLKFLLGLTENIHKGLMQFSSDQDEEFKELGEFANSSLNESARL